MMQELNQPEVPPPTTLRDVLRPIFGDAALAEAEGRIYDRLNGMHYGCADGLCAMAVIAYEAHLSLPDNLYFPSVRALIGALEREGKLTLRTWGPTVVVLETIIDHNDSGELIASGTLTTLLDSALPVVGEVTL